MQCVQTPNLRASIPEAKSAAVCAFVTRVSVLVSHVQCLQGGCTPQCRGDGGEAIVHQAEAAKAPKRLCQYSRMTASWIMARAAARSGSRTEYGGRVWVTDTS